MEACCWDTDAMSRHDLETCPFFGPYTGDGPAPAQRELPADYAADPFKYLPPRIELSAAELQLAQQYENGDLSGGYVTSQIAYFRRPQSKQRHRDRREHFARLKHVVASRGLTLPAAFIKLVETDDYIDRLRHNTIWLRLPDEVVPLPADPARQMFLIFSEGQGCGYWHLLLAPDGTHVVAYADEPFGLQDIYPAGHAPDLAALKVFQCAMTFEAWIVHYFLDCSEDDRHYEELLVKYPGM